MTTDFESLLRDSAPPAPDPGDSRRLNRALLRQRLARDVRRRRWHRRSVALAASLVLGFVLMGPGPELGGDNFEMSEPFNIPYSSVPRVTIGLRQQGATKLDGYTDDEIVELANRHYMKEGELVSIVGEYMTDSYYWAIGHETFVNGKKVVMGENPEDFPLRVTKNMMDFSMKERYKRYRGQMKDIPGPNPTQMVVTIDGTAFTFDVYRFVDPEYGPYEYYLWEAPR